MKCNMCNKCNGSDPGPMTKVWGVSSGSVTSDTSITKDQKIVESAVISTTYIPAN